MPKIIVEVVDVKGSFKRLIKEAPKVARKHLFGAVFSTAAAVRTTMEATAPLGPTGQGRTPLDHIKNDIEHRQKDGSLSARVGIFDDPDQVAVATYNEYAPDQQPFMKPSALANESRFHTLAINALQLMERYLSQGF